MKIKEECLDVKVSSPQNGKGVILRFIKESEYPLYYKHYPSFFIIDNELVDNANNITDTTNVKKKLNSDFE